MKERIIEFLKAENKSSAQLAEEIGVQPSGISHILSGRNKPSLDFVLKMLEKYKFLATEWLLFGKGSMYRDSIMQELFSDDLQPSEKPAEIKPEKQSESPDNEKLPKKMIKNVTDAGIVPERIVWFYNDKSFREYFPEGGESGT